MSARIDPDNRERYTDYLATRELLRQLLFNNHQVTISFDDDSSINGHI